MNLFKRKKVSNQERGINLTLEQLKQSTDVRFEEIYNYLDKIAKNMLDEGGAIKGNLNIEGDITQNGQKIGSVIDSLTSTSATDALSANQGKALNESSIKYKHFYGLSDSVLDDIPTLLGEDYQSAKPYSIFFNPATADSLYGGCNFIVEGFHQNGGYGSQIAYSYDGENIIKKRSQWNGVWSEWTSISLTYNTPSIKLDASKLIYVTPEHSAVTNYSPYGNTYYYKIGTKVHLHIGVKIDTTEWITMFTLPEGFRPASLVSAQGVGSSPQNITGIQIDTAGRVQTSTTSGYCCLDIEYDAGF